MRFPPTLRPALILGGSGRIGGILRHQWASAGADLRWQRRARPDGAETEVQGWHVFDPLADPEALAEAARGAAAILCLAGPVPGGAAGHDLSARQLVQHRDLALAALEAAAHVRDAGAGTRTGAPRVLLASSAAVYGAAPGSLSEDTPLAPVAPYGVTKAEMEQAAQARAAELGLGVTLLRIGNIAGIDAILGGWQPGFCLDQFADGQTPRRSYIGPRTLADVLATLIRCPDLPQVLNIAQPGLVAMGDLLQAAGLEFARRPAPAQAIAEVQLDVTRLIGLLAAQPVPAADLPACLPVATAADLVAEARVLDLLPNS
ncbi:NAD-dependent epimerase/dehydratase family protein [Phaeobacter inhibens]|uniref:NAD-dependent epimerase/dehydratase family protein n=1 Tax=Phaeobacter inhibens TaxID=221822 RepID=UPI000CA3D723|nr:NAD-dependent epimerase/dehydratase family protein [Phaeobacter inhibens]AUQ64833.1 putative NAD dependent epimerase/dehydratase [Phaeobacter inhibens]AUQ84672.1 putative NAD dependent epimerase/dehydratase [Phaeobacter inhibens]AUQ92752.1 putative NAD dependent epimerase/dehydratase [Phaeobacter inhibens]MDO6758398.1 NAD-dependent epimerase/dehydratase family protein [Phaeobacter inhibens]